MQRAGWLIGGLLAATLVLSGCGVRGAVELSDEDKAAVAAEKANQTPPKRGEPNKPFVLDGLIR